MNQLRLEILRCIASESRYGPNVERVVRSVKNGAARFEIARMKSEGLIEDTECLGQTFFGQALYRLSLTDKGREALEG